MQVTSPARSLWNRSKRSSREIGRRCSFNEERGTSVPRQRHNRADDAPRGTKVPRSSFPQEPEHRDRSNRHGIGAQRQAAKGHRHGAGGQREKDLLSSPSTFRTNEQRS